MGRLASDGFWTAREILRNRNRRHRRANSRIHLARWAVPPPAESHGRQTDRPRLPWPCRPQPAGSANVERFISSPFLEGSMP